MIQKVSATDARIEEFKTWDGAAWFRHHLNWLKGSYHVAQLPKGKPEKEEVRKREKQRPYINELKRDSLWKYLVAEYGKRQAKKMCRAID